MTREGHACLHKNFHEVKRWTENQILIPLGGRGPGPKIRSMIHYLILWWSEVFPEGYVPIKSWKYCKRRALCFFFLFWNCFSMWSVTLVFFFFPTRLVLQIWKTHGNIIWMWWCFFDIPCYMFSYKCMKYPCQTFNTWVRV